MSTHTRQSVLAEAIENSRALVGRFTVGFDDSTHTKQTPHLPNHFAWCMGHLALTMHRVAGYLDGNPLADSDFLIDSTKGDRQRFGSETVSFASKPTSDAAIYPTHARCIEIFNAAIDRLANAVRRADDATLDKVVKWGGGESAVSALIPRMVYHNGVHAGQIIDLRRALGMKPVFS
jgi:hypothetical protein